jgi:hypothetical protein
MPRCLWLAVAAVALVATGCDPATAKVKGRLVENGQPLSFPPTTASVQLSPCNPDGTPDMSKVYACVVEPDGTFVLHASGGEVPTGKYFIAVEVTGKPDPKFKPFSGPTSPIRRDLKSGMNDLTIDIGKPEG